MILLFLYLFLALFISFLCSIMEAVLLSTPQSFLIVKQENGIAWAKSFAHLKTNVDKPLSAILSLNTVAHTVGAAGVGAQAVKIYGEEAFGIISAILTILILVITEIIPKTIGARFWRNLAKPSYFVIQGMIFITYPLVAMSAVITKLISSEGKESTTSREEILALANIGADEGIFSTKEHKIIQNLFRFKCVNVREIMTPRVVVTLANEKQTLKEFYTNFENLKFSRVPVYSENEEHVSGYVFRQDVLEKLLQGEEELTLQDVKRNLLIVPSSIVLFELWEKLLEDKEHIALIVDEYGGVDGIVSMEDIIETLLGLEITDETDTVVDMRKFAKERWVAKQAQSSIVFDK